MNEICRVRQNERYEVCDDEVGRLELPAMPRRRRHGRAADGPTRSRPKGPEPRGARRIKQTFRWHVCNQSGEQTYLRPGCHLEAASCNSRLNDRGTDRHLAVCPSMVRVARLELAASSSQSWRPTNWATPGNKRSDNDSSQSRPLQARRDGVRFPCRGRRPRRPDAS